MHQVQRRQRDMAEVLATATQGRWLPLACARCVTLVLHPLTCIASIPDACSTASG